MNMKEKRESALCSLAMLANNNMQNTEGDYEAVRNFIKNLGVSMFKKEFTDDEVREVLNPLWNYYMSNLHDGYNVTVPREEM